MSQELQQRNILALADGLKELNSRFGQMAGQISDLKAQVAVLQQQLMNANQSLAVLRVKSLGHGPTT